MITTWARLGGGCDLKNDIIEVHCKIQHFCNLAHTVGTKSQDTLASVALAFNHPLISLPALWQYDTHLLEYPFKSYSVEQLHGYLILDENDRWIFF